MFATGDTLAINAFRALAALASHPNQRARAIAELGEADGLDGERVVGLAYLEGCLEEAMRLWPTTTMLSRETLADTEWGGPTVPAGTQVLIPNTFLHRDRDRHAWADEFAPHRWVSGEAAGDWSFNHFSRGPQGCPGYRAGAPARQGGAGHDPARRFGRARLALDGPRQAAAAHARLLRDPGADRLTARPGSAPRHSSE